MPAFGLQEDVTAALPDELDPAPHKQSVIFRVAKVMVGQAKGGKLAQELQALIGQGAVLAIKHRVEEAIASAMALRSQAEGRDQNLGAGHQQLAQAIAEASYQAAAITAATLAVEAAFIGDPLVKKAKEIASLAPFVEKTTMANKLTDAASLAVDLETLITEFDAMVDAKADYLAKVGESLLKTLARKEFTTLAGLADGVARDAALLTAVRGARASNLAESTADQALAAQATQEKWLLIDKQVLQLQQSLLAGEHGFAVELAKLVSTGGSVMGDPTMAKAVELTRASRQLLQAFREQKVALVDKMCSTLAKQAGIFNGPLMARANQLSELCNQFEKARESQDSPKMAQLAVTMARTAAVLVDPTIRRGSLLAGDIPKVETYLKRKDFSGAVGTLDAALK